MKEAREQHPGLRVSRRERMQEPEAVAQMLALARLGWGTKRIARELGVARNTVKRYVAASAAARSPRCRCMSPESAVPMPETSIVDSTGMPYRSPAREGKLAGLATWLQVQFAQHRGNCDVVRQELQRQQGVSVSLRTVERACLGYRAEWAAQARATVRFETAPGQQLQIDFGSATLEIDGARQKVHVFVATLGYSRLGYVAAFRHERQAAWLAGLEGAFAHFGGIPREVLLDNAKALVLSHGIQTREVRFNERLLAFARHWGFTPKACAPFRPRTKGKDENGVGYVKKNALAGHVFTSWEALSAHLVRWQREVSDVRCHGTTAEAPRLRFERDERAALQPLAGKPPFAQARELQRVVSSEACVEVDTNRYSVPWRLIGEGVSVNVTLRRPCRGSWHGPSPTMRQSRAGASDDRPRTAHEHADAAAPDGHPRSTGQPARRSRPSGADAPGDPGFPVPTRDCPQGRTTHPYGHAHCPLPLCRHLGRLRLRSPAQRG